MENQKLLRKLDEEKKQRFKIVSKVIKKITADKTKLTILSILKGKEAQC